MNATIEINEKTRIPLGMAVAVVSFIISAIVSITIVVVTVRIAAARANERLDEVVPRVSTLEVLQAKDMAEIRSDIRAIRVRLKIPKGETE